MEACQFLPQIESETLGENAVWKVCSMRRAVSSEKLVTTRPPPTPLLLKGRFPRNAIPVLSQQGSYRRRAPDYAMELAKEVRASNIRELVSAPLEEAIRQVTGVVIEFNRKHAAFNTLYTEAPLSKDTLEQKQLLSSLHRASFRGADGEKSPTG